MKKEIHLHCAVTAAGDPYGLTKDAREDQELNQWAARIPAQHVGSVKKIQVEKMFAEFFVAAVDEMRKAGILAQGE